MRFFILFFIFTTSIAFSQKKIKHIVVNGESIYSISKKYDVKESDIFDLNPKAKGSLLQLKSVLWIPNKNYNPKEKITSKEATKLAIDHQVLANETLYGISKKYKTTLTKIKNANPSIEIKGIKEGNIITIPVSKEVFDSQTNLTTNATTPVILPEVQKNPETVSQNTDEAIMHHVVAKETKYGISKRYNISIDELEKLNPKIVKGLSIGDELIIRQGKAAATAIAVVSQNNVNNTESVNLPSMSFDAASKVEFLIAKASENLGLPYRGGGMDRNGFDCSGLIFSTFKQIDMTLPRSSSDMAASAGVKIDMSQAQKGDLIFFTTTRRGGISHVGMVTEVSGDEIKFIHSSTSTGVMISSTKEEYYTKRFVQINRVL